MNLFPEQRFCVKFGDISATIVCNTNAVSNIIWQPSRTRGREHEGNAVRATGWLEQVSAVVWITPTWTNQPGQREEIASGVRLVVEGSVFFWKEGGIQSSLGNQFQRSWSGFWKMRRLIHDGFSRWWGHYLTTHAMHSGDHLFCRPLVCALEIFSESERV